MRTITMTVLVGFLLPVSACSDEPADEQAVWALEEAYWAYVKNNDIDAYLTLWDERFVGWPGFSDAPVGKANIGDWIAPLQSESSGNLRL